MNRLLLLSSILCLLPLILAHEHMDSGPYNPEMNFLNEEPIDLILKFHIGIQTLVWGVLFPVGMILGINKSRFHVPFQSISITLTLVGNYLAHHHRGREFHSTAHSKFSNYLLYYLISQTIIGIFLKTHLGQKKSFRKLLVNFHGIIGRTFPIIGWSQIVLGAIASLGFCFGDHTGQCVAHFAMGSGFIFYGLFLLFMMKVGGPFLIRKQWSQELIDSNTIMLFGIITTFTMHNFLGGNDIEWNHKDMQHTSLGIMWWSGGALGSFLSWKGKRNIVPSIILMFTGWSMSSHAQSLDFSTKLHQVFGFALITAGATRLIEICFVLKDSPSPQISKFSKAFQHLPPYLLVLSGLTFMSSTEEQMEWSAGSGMDHVTYANLLFSGAFIIYLLTISLLEFYLVTVPDKLENEEGLENRNEIRRLEEGSNSPRSWIRNLLHSNNSGNQDENGRIESYEAVPLGRTGPSSASSSERRERVERELEEEEGTVFDIGDLDDAEEINASDSYWKEKP